MIIKDFSTNTGAFSHYIFYFCGQIKKMKQLHDE